MKKSTSIFIASFIFIFPFAAHAGEASSPIRQIEVQTVEITIPETLLAQLKHQPALTTSENTKPAPVAVKALTGKYSSFSP